VSATLHPAAPHHLPPFLPGPDGSDWLLTFAGIMLLGSVLAFGLVFLRIHTLPERMAHRGHKLQFEIVAVLGLLALFTHIHLFWVAALLLALVDIPDFSGPMRRIAGSAEKIASLPPGGGRHSRDPARSRRSAARPAFAACTWRGRTAAGWLSHARDHLVFPRHDPAGLPVPPLCAGQADRP
jgi:hypothetical protein